MKGIRFYAEYDSPQAKRAGNPDPKNVVAVLLDNDNHPICGPGGCECLSALLHEADSPVCGSSVSRAYLIDNCKLVSEEVAREIHPKMFERIDQ